MISLSACVLGTRAKLNSAETYGELQYKIPSTWEFVQSTEGNYYYVNDNKLNGFLYVSRTMMSDMDAYDISDKDVAYGLIDNVIEGLISATPDYVLVEKVQSKIHDTVYYTLVDYKAVIDGYDYEVICMVFLSSTSVYQMSFLQQSEVSSENEEIFYNIIDTIKLED
jgi:hypothetical protein